MRDSRKFEASLKIGIPSTNRAKRTGICMWKTLDDHVAEWLLETRQNGFAVSRNAIRIYKHVIIVLYILS